MQPMSSAEGMGVLFVLRVSAPQPAGFPFVFFPAQAAHRMKETQLSSPHIASNARLLGEAASRE